MKNPVVTQEQEFPPPGTILTGGGGVGEPLHPNGPCVFQHTPLKLSPGLLPPQPPPRAQLWTARLSYE